MTSNLEILFQFVLISAKQLCENDIHADGLAFWKSIKELLLVHDPHDNIIASCWKKHVSDDIANCIMSLSEYTTADSKGKKYMIKSNHFLIQTVRLAIKEKPSLRKVIQVALNIGQYIGMGHSRMKWMYLHEYLTKEDIEKLSGKVPNELISKVYNVIIKKEKTTFLEELQERLKDEQKRMEEQKGKPFFSVIIDEKKVHSYRTTNQPEWTNIQKIVGGKFDVYSKTHLKKKFQKFTVLVRQDHNILYNVNNNCNFMLTDEYAKSYPIHGKCIIMKDADFGDSISMTQEDLDLFIRKD